MDARWFGQAYFPAQLGLVSPIVKCQSRVGHNSISCSCHPIALSILAGVVVVRR